jgi:copper resistance protein D
LIDPGTALEAGRFLHDTAAMLLWGCFVYLSALVPKDLARRTGRTLDGFRVGAALVVIATAALALPIRAAMIGSGWSDALDPGVLWPVLTATHVGRAWIWNAVASILLAGTLFVPERLMMPATALASGTVLATLSLTGHAAMHEGWVGAVHRTNDLVHVLASGGWFGALLPLAVILKGVRGTHEAASAKKSLKTFSVAGHIAVALAVLTGAINTLLILGHWPTDWTAPYQALLTLKIALVLFMICLASLNRYRQMPGFDKDPAGTARAIRQGAIWEIVLGVGVIGLVAVFGMLAPM